MPIHAESNSNPPLRGSVRTWSCAVASSRRGRDRSSSHCRIQRPWCTYSSPVSLERCRQRPSRCGPAASRQLGLERRASAGIIRVTEEQTGVVNRCGGHGRHIATGNRHRKASGPRLHERRLPGRRHGLAEHAISSPYGAHRPLPAVSPSPNPSVERTHNGGARLFAPSRSQAPLCAAHVKR